MTSATVILIGGNSGTGKTRAAAEISQRHGASLLLADDLRLALQRESSRSDKPELHFFVRVEDYLSRLSAVEIRDGLVGVATVVSHALEIVIAHHLHTELPIVIEGDGILPSLAAMRAFDGREASGRVRSAFLVETDRNEIFSNSLKRGRGMESRPSDEQSLYAEASALFGGWISAEAQRLQLPVISSRPLDTLVDRTEAAILG